MRKLAIIAYATAAVLCTPAWADPDPGPVVETCAFLPVVNRLLLPPIIPCYLPPPPPEMCYDERGVLALCGPI